MDELGRGFDVDASDWLAGRDAAADIRPPTPRDFDFDDGDEFDLNRYVEDEMLADAENFFDPGTAVLGVA